MTKKEAQKAATRLFRVIRTLVDLNPKTLKNATFYIHGIPEDKMPEVFELEKDWGAYRTYNYKDPDGAFEVKLFTAH